MKGFLTLIFLMSSLSSLASTKKVECHFLSGTKVTKTFQIEYRRISNDFSDKVKVKLSGNSIGIENNLSGKLVKTIKHEALLPLHQDIQVERQGDYDSIRIDFLFDDNLKNESYATLRYMSDGPFYAGFYRCGLK